GSFAARLAVPPMVERVHGVAGVDERLGDMAVATRVLPQAVYQDDDGAGVSGVGQPGLVMDARPVERRERPLGVLHGARRYRGPPPISAVISASRSSNSSTAGNWGNSSMTFCGAWNKKPASAAASIEVSLYESPAATTRYSSEWNASTARRF